jgi:hypothetical protein
MFRDLARIHHAWAACLLAGWVLGPRCIVVGDSQHLAQERVHHPLREDLGKVAKSLACPSGTRYGWSSAHAARRRQPRFLLPQFGRKIVGIDFILPNLLRAPNLVKKSRHVDFGCHRSRLSTERLIGLYKLLPSNCKHLLEGAVTSCRSRESNSQKPGFLEEPASKAPLAPQLSRGGAS